MAKSDNVIGLAIGLDTSSLKAGLQDAGRRLKETSAQFKEQTSGIDDWSKSTVGLGAKLKQLNTNLAIQSAALELMEKEYRENTKGQDDMSAKAVKLRTDIANQKVAIAQTERSIEKYSKSLEELENSQQDTEKAVVDTNKSLKDQEAASQRVSDGFTIMKGVVANLIATGISKLASGFKNLISSALQSSEATREYREDIGKLEASFARSNKSSESANKAYQKLYSTIGETDTAVEAAQQISLLAKSEEDVAKWSKLATGVVGTFGDALKVETFYEAANETLNLGKATGAFTQMLEQTGINVEDFDNHLASLKTEEEKQAYMLAVSEKALGKAGEAYEKVNADVIKAREESAAFTKTQAELGAKMEPVNSAITSFKNELLQLIIKNVDFEKVAKKVNEILTKFKDEVLPKVIEGFEWVKDNLPEIKTAVVALGSAFVGLKVASIITGIVKAMKTWTVATKGMTVAQKALNLVMKANPLGIVITLVTALVGVITYLWKTNEGFRDAVIKIWEKIKNAFSVAVEFIKNLFYKALDFIKSYFMFYINLYKTIWNGLISFFSSLWNGIKNIFSKVGQWFTNVFTSAKNGIVNAFNSVLGFFQNLWTRIKNVFSSVGSFFGGIWNTIKEKFTDIGQKIGESISGAFKKAINGVLKTAEKVLNAPIKAINSLLDKVKEVVNIPKLKTFDLPRMAKGGVVDKATLGIFGEDGQEAVIPLERNLGWIKKISAQLIKDMNELNNISSSSNNINNTRNFTQIINAPKQPPIDELYRRAGSLIKMDKVVY